MAKKVFTDESLATFVDEVKSYTDNAVSSKADSSHNHSASNITSGTLSSDRLPTVPIAKGGTGATTAADALTNLGVTATAAELNKLDGVTATTTELNYVDGVTSNIQTQFDTLTSDKVGKSGDTMTGDLTIKANFGSVRFNDVDGNKMSVLQANNDSHTTSIYAYPTDKSTYYEKYDFPTPSTGATTNKVYKVLTTKDVTATVAELNYVDGVTSNIQTQLDNKSDSSHTHSSYVNQNAFSNIAVSGQTTVAADTATDTVTFAGSNMSITTNATTDTVTFSVANASTSDKGVVQLVDSATNTATDKAATANAVNIAYTLASKANTTANSAKTTAESKSTVEASSTNGKIKIDGTDTTVYTHPTTAGNKHIPSGGSSGQVLKYSSSGSATWGTDKDTTYSLSSGDSNGTIKITPSSGSSYNVGVKGLGSVAYTNTVPVAQGGTGATTAAAARTNLGALGTNDIVDNLDSDSPDLPLSAKQGKRLANKKFGCYSARGSNSEFSIPASDVTIVPLTHSIVHSSCIGSSGSTDGFELNEKGGVIVPFNGNILVSGCIHFRTHGKQVTRGCYIKHAYMVDSTTEKTVEVGSQYITDPEGKLSNISSGAIIVPVSDGDIIYLCARSSEATRVSLTEVATQLNIAYINYA